MEQSQRFKYKLKVFEKAIEGFGISLEIEISSFSNEVSDAIKNGCIQKFEYCTELTWKIIKSFLYIYHNVDAKSPRESIKEFFLIKAVNDSDYNLLTKILEDRNKLSHIYNEEHFDEIYNKLKNYLKVMKRVAVFIREESEKGL
jgi:nucleotidyltransferase substrate binding protein (TIGR01987 family)